MRVDPDLNAQSRMGHYRSLALVDFTDDLVVPAPSALETPVRRLQGMWVDRLRAREIEGRLAKACYSCSSKENRTSSGCQRARLPAGRACSGVGALAGLVSSTARVGSECHACLSFYGLKPLVHSALHAVRAPGWRVLGDKAMSWAPGLRSGTRAVPASLLKSARPRWYGMAD